MQHRQNRGSGFSLLLREGGFGSGVPRGIACKLLVCRTQQRRRAEPEYKHRGRQDDSGKQKAEAGQHGTASSAFAEVRRQLNTGNAVTTELPRSQRIGRHQREANQAVSRIPQRSPNVRDKSAEKCRPRQGSKRFVPR
jgi:hypothetical protein